MATHIRNLQFWNRDKQHKPLHSNSIVVITGGGSGIGRAIAHIYSKRFINIVLADININALDNVKQECIEYGARHVLTIQCDVTNYDNVKNVYNEIYNAYNTHNIDILVLCAGLNAHHLFSNTHDITVYHRLMNVNYYGYLYFTHVFYDSLCSTNGTLIAITSFSGEVGLPYRTAYCASKFAVTGFLEALRAEMSYVYNNNNNNNNNSTSTNTNNRFDIVIVCPPSVDTPLRHNSIKVDSNITETAPSKFSMTVEQCASAIVDAGDRRLRKAFLSPTSFWANYLRPIIPDQIDKLIMKRAKL